MSFRIEKNNLSPQDRAVMDNMAARAARNEANVSYLSMMTDVELPDMTESYAEDMEGTEDE